MSTRSTRPAKQQRYSYGGTGYLRWLFLVMEGGNPSHLDVQVDSASLQAKEYLGFKVLEGEEGIG